MDNQLGDQKQDHMIHLMAEVELKPQDLMKLNAKPPVRPTKAKRIRLDDEDPENQDQQTQEGQYITLKVGEQRTITFNLDELSSDETILDLKRRHFISELERGLTVRFISMGRLLGDALLLNTFKWTNNQVVLVHISEPLPQEVPAPIPPPQENEDQQNIQVLNEQELQDLQAQLNIMVNQRNVIAQLVQEQIPPLENEGTYMDMIIGLILGFVFFLLAVLGLCFCPCSIKAKQGVMLGFIARLIYAQIFQIQPTSTL